MSLEVFVLGTGGMMPLPHRFLTSVLVRRKGELFLFDCGEGTQISLKKLNLRWKKISVILISHTHADHVTGLPGILMLSSQVERTEPLYIIGPPKIKEYIEATRQILDIYINYEIIVKQVFTEGVVFNGAGYQIRAFALKHSKPCLGYTIEEDLRAGVFYPEKARALEIPRGPLWSQLQSGQEVKRADGTIVYAEQVMGPKRRGVKLGFVTDTLYSDTISSYVKQADLFFCEAMFTEDLLESAQEKKHLTARQAALIAKEAGVKSLALIHYSPRYTERELLQLKKEAQQVFARVFLTKDRQIIEVKNPE